MFAVEFDFAGPFEIFSWRQLTNCRCTIDGQNYVSLLEAHLYCNMQFSSATFEWGFLGVVGFVFFTVSCYF